MRATLLTAQKMADSIVHEAEAKRDQMLKEAETGAQEQIAQYQKELDEARERLLQGQQELARFITASRDLCAKELQFLDQLPSAPVSAPQAPDPSPVEEIEENVMAAFSTQTPEDAPQEAAPAETAQEPEAPADDYPEGDPFAREDLGSTRRINLEELKFGRNYSGED